VFFFFFFSKSHLEGLDESVVTYFVKLLHQLKDFSSIYRLILRQNLKYDVRYP